MELELRMIGRFNEHFFYFQNLVKKFPTRFLATVYSVSKRHIEEGILFLVFWYYICASSVIISTFQ